jgi:hypothetical protein
VAGPFGVKRIPAISLLALIATACGSTPTSPSGAIVLPDGDYVLSISLGTLPPIGGSPTFCMSTPSGPLSMTATLPVRVTRSGDRWTVRMPQASGPGGGSLHMSIAAQAASGGTSVLEGTIEGSGRAADDSVTATVVSPTTVSGTLPTANMARGQIAGDVRLEAAQGSLTCRSVSWMLSQR